MDMMGEISIDDHIEYLNCSSGDSTGIICVTFENGQQQSFRWNPFTQTEAQALALARNAYNQSISK